MRRRRKNRATWLPIIPTQYGGEGEAGLVTWYETTLSFPSGTRNPGDTAVTAFPLTYDDSFEQEAITSEASLRDRVEGQDYVLDRIVGQVWMQQGFSQSSIRSWIGCIAFGVFPSASNGGIALDPVEYHPLLAGNAAQPWIWRRTWRCDSPGFWGLPRNPPLGAFPVGSAGYSGIREGGFVDTKGSRRRIRKEHRLFIVAAAGILGETAESPQDPNVIQFGYDLRLIGGMRRAHNVSSF